MNKIIVTVQNVILIGNVNEVDGGIMMDGTADLSAKINSYKLKGNRGWIK